MYLIRHRCAKHNCDLECVETNSDGNPENALFRISTEEAASWQPFDAATARLAGIVDANDGHRLKEGTYYLFDYSSFVCPEMPEIPDDLPPEMDEQLYCVKFWTSQVEEIGVAGKLDVLARLVDDVRKLDAFTKLTYNMFVEAVRYLSYDELTVLSHHPDLTEFQAEAVAERAQDLLCEQD